MSILLVSSCDPELDYEVPVPEPKISTVQILDKISKKPVENAKVKIIHVEYISWSRAIWTDKETQYSDKNGIVKFSREYSSGHDIEIYESDKYFRNYNYSVSKDKEVLYQEPKSWVEIEIKDLNPDDGMERVVVNSYAIYNLYLDLDFVGDAIYSKSIFLAHPGNHTEFKIENYKNSGIIKYSLFADIPPGDTLEMDVFFK